MPLSTADISASQVGASTADFGKNLAIAARDAYCAAYRADPLGVRQWGVSSPVGSALGALNESFCRNVPPPTNAFGALPLTGAQCAVLYRVENDWSGEFFPGFSNPNRPSSGVSGSNVLGPITKVESGVVDGVAVDNPYQSQIKVYNASGLVATLSSGPLNVVGSYRFNFYRIDGQADSCGDPTPTPTPDPLPQPQPSVRYVPVPIPGPQGGVYVVPIILKPVVTLAPKINLQVGPWNVQIGPVDIDISPNFEFDSDYTPPPIVLPPTVPQPPPLPPGGKDCPPVNLDRVINRINQLDVVVDGRFDSVDDDLEELLDCDRCNKEKVQQATAIGAGQSGSADLPEGTFKVRLILGSIPSSERVQFVENAPNILYIGSYSFGDDSGFGERTPVSFQQTTCFAPEKATKFYWQLHDGVTATAIAYALVEQQ